MNEELKNELSRAERLSDDLVRVLDPAQGRAALDRERVYKLACDLHAILGRFDPRSIRDALGGARE